MVILQKMYSATKLATQIDATISRFLKTARGSYWDTTSVPAAVFLNPEFMDNSKAIEVGNVRYKLRTLAIDLQRRKLC